jgi:hypothetical protein
MNKQPTEKRISIRFPIDLLEAIRKQAKANERSFNGEVIWLLRKAIEQELKV